MLDKNLREMTERMEKWERSDDSFRHNLTGKVKEENEKIVSVIEGLIKKLQEEREEEENTAAGGTAAEPKKKGACFICQDPGHYAPDCPNKKEKKAAAPYKGGNNYDQKGNPNAWYQRSQYFQSGKPRQDGPTIAERKQKSNFYHCGQQERWASDCPIKDIPAYNQDFWSDIDNMIAKEMPPNALPHPVQPEPQPIQVQPFQQPFQQPSQPVQQVLQPTHPAPKKRNSPSKRKTISDTMDLWTNFYHFCVVLNKLFNILHAFSICVLCLSKFINYFKTKN